MSRATQVIIPADAFPADRLPSRSRAVAACIELAKPGITRLVTITAIGGFALRAATDASTPAIAYVVPLLGCALGVALASAGGNALNMWFEARLDARMVRTAGRPLPTGRLRASTAFAFGLWTTLIGTLIVAITGSPIAGALTLLSVALYVLVYTPSKVRTPWSTLIGAVPGALPPLIGAAAAAGPQSGFAAMTDPIGLSLFALMVVWQLPHFMAIATMHRDDYAAAGMRMLPVVAPSGRSTRFVTRLTALVLIAAAAAPALTTPLLGWPYALFAILTSAAFAALAFRLGKPKAIFLASIAHLPLLMLAMVAESAARGLL